MKTRMYYPLLLIALVAAVFSSCQKGSLSSTNSASGTLSKTASTSTVLATGSIAIGTTTTLASTHIFSSHDSIYLTHCFPRHGYKDSIVFSTLPAAALTYLSTNYSGYTAVKAFAIKDSTKTVINYIAVIKYNGNIVGIKFTTTGTFVAVLEQEAGQDLGDDNNQGCHQGGPFDDRGGFRPDTIALSAIPTVVKTYFTTNYAKDTLLMASIAPDGDYVLISKNVTLFATVLTPTGTLVAHSQIDARNTDHAAVTAANLPAAITTYLTATYPGYVFNRAYSEKVNGVLQGYDVIITSNNTQYLVQFNASGSFIGFKPIH